jgi:hypothetical protein
MSDITRVGPVVEVPTTGALVLAGALMLSWVALFNQAPLVFADSRAAYDQPLQSNRHRNPVNIAEGSNNLLEFRPKGGGAMTAELYRATHPRHQGRGGLGCRMIKLSKSSVR